mgnify:CR=1 FL=1
MKTDVRAFLVDIAENEVLKNKAYSFRIPLDDGGDNSYIGFSVELDDWRNNGKIRGLSLFRHTNSVKLKSNEWKFDLGDICDTYYEYPDIPIQFASYGKTPEEATAEAQGYFKEIKRLIKKRTAEYKIEMAKTAEKEKEELLARLAELESVT